MNAGLADPRAERRAVFAMVVATILWGATFVVLRDSLVRLTPGALVFSRFAIAGVVLVVLLAALGRRPRRRELIGGVVAGACGGAGFLGQAIGLTAVSAGTSAFLTSTGTLFTAFLAWPLLGQRPTPLLVAGIGLALLGSLLLSMPIDLSASAGEAWTLLGACAFGLQIVVLARVAPDADPLVVTAVQVVTIAALHAPWAPAAVRELAALPPAGWLRLGYLIAAGSTIAPLLQVGAQATLAAGRVGLLFALEPVFALVFALTLGGERYASPWWLGAALILGAVVLVESRALVAPPASRPAT